jgi:ferrochelatase
MSEHLVDNSSFQNSTNKTGVLITNLGSPDAPTKNALRQYLKQFLSDKFVIQPPPSRFIWLCILHGVILNFRPAKSAKKYQKIWTNPNDKAPLISLCQNLLNQLKQQPFAVTNMIEYSLGMRYGNPSISGALEDLRDKGCDQIIVLPLYPQYSKTTTESTFFEVSKITKNWQNIPKILLINNYHDNDSYIDALASSIMDFQAENGVPDKLLISYHSIPQRYVNNGDCYYEHCQATTRLLVEKLNLNEADFVICFQSIFGREKWIGPNISHVLANLSSENVPHVQVVCPGFPVDCLETLEEIDMENRQIFLDNGGAKFHYIPALNSSAAQLSLISDLLQSELNT